MHFKAFTYMFKCLEYVNVHICNMQMSRKNVGNLDQSVNSGNFWIGDWHFGRVGQ